MPGSALSGVSRSPGVVAAAFLALLAAGLLGLDLALNRGLAGFSRTGFSRALRCVQQHDALSAPLAAADADIATCATACNVTCPSQSGTAAPSAPPAGAEEVAGVGPASAGLPVPAALQSKFMAATDYQPALPEHVLRKGIVSYGDLTRTRRLMHKLLSGQAITAVYIGGSITWGQGASQQGVTDHVPRTFRWIREAFPHANHTLLNNAIPATPTTYMALCLRWHVPGNADLVVLEYNINDGGARFDTPVRRAHERLVRKLLAYPNLPAVMEVVVFRWALQELPSNEIPYRYAGDDEIGVLAQYYHLPWLSMRSLMWDSVYIQQVDPQAQQPFFMADADHPNDLGHQYLSDMVIGVMRRALEDLALHPYSGADEAFAREALPPPMLKDNWPTRNNSCIMGPLFKERVVAAEGFEWVNEGTPEKEKLGWVATAPGATLSFEINTAMAPVPTSAAGAPTPVGLVHLKSYEHMGRAELSCVSGCSCEPYTLNGHIREPVSQVYFELWQVSRAERCVIQARVLPETDSGEHKVKLTGVIISEVPGQHDLPSFNLAVDFNTNGAASYVG